MLLLAVLLPVAIYLGLLGWINRRPHGLLVKGPWDFAGILFAASGLILFGGPSLLGSLTHTDGWRKLWIEGRFHDAADPIALGRVVLFAVYFLGVVISSALVLWYRRGLTSIYNVHPSLVETVLEETLRGKGLSFTRVGNVLLIDPDRGGTDLSTSVPPSVLVEQVTALELEVSVGLCHATLSWDPADSLLRREVESQLRLALAQQPAPGGALGDWFLLAASFLFFLIVIGLGYMVLVLPRLV